MQEEEGELPAGVPSARSNRVIVAVAAAVLAVPMLIFFGYLVFRDATHRLSDTIARIPIPGLGTPADAPLEIEAGSHLVFAVDTSYEFSGNPVVVLDISLLKDGSETAKTDCNMHSFTGVKPSGSGGIVWYGDAGWFCTLDVPEGGATSIRAIVSKQGEGSLSLSHTSLIVKRQ